MKKYIISIILSLLAATSFAANNTDGLGSLRVGVKDILRSSSDVLDEIKRIDDKYNEVVPSTIDDISSASSSIQKEINTIKNDINDLINKIKENGLDDKSVSSKCKEISKQVSDFSESFEKHIKDSYQKKEEALKEYKESIEGKYETLKSQTEDLANKVKSIYNDGVAYNLPIGIEADFGSVYVNLQIDKMEFSRGTNGEHTKGHAVATVTLPFLPKQEDETKSISMSGDILFKHNGESISRISVQDNLRIPIIKDRVYLVLFGIKNSQTKMGQCELPKENGYSYIEFSCNEITDVNLVGYFDFSGSIDENGDPRFLIACDKDGNKLENENEHVTAPFILHGKGGVSSQLCFSHPFKVKGLGDFVFTVKDGVIDFSDIQNPDGLVVPSYWTSPLTPQSWIGFYLKTLEVKLPESFFLNKSDSRTQFAVSNMYIDDYGFSGDVAISSLINKDLGGAGASISIEEITAHFLQNEFTGGKLNGNVTLPFLSQFEEGTSPESEANSFGTDEAPKGKDKEHEDDILKKKDENKKILELSFSADVSYVDKKNGTKVSSDNTDSNTEDPAPEPEKHYVFNANVGLKKDHKYRVPFTSLAYVTLKGGTSLSITNDQDKMYGENSDVKEEDRKGLMFTFCMSGELGVTSPKAISKGSNKLGFDLEFKDVQFKNLTFCNVGNPVNIESIALNGKIGAKLLGLSIAITKLEYKSNEQIAGNITYDGKDYPIWKGKLGMDAKVELIGGSNGIGADLSSKFRFINNSHGPELKDIKWDYDGFEIGRVGLHANYSAFKLDGYLDIFKDDEIFGKGFRGSIDMGIDPIGLSIGAQICFGKTNHNRDRKYSYWFTRASAEMASTHILLFPPAVFLSSITGGAYSHMSSKPIDQTKGMIFVSDVRNYEPDPSVKFGFIAGIGVYIGSENLAKAKAEMELTFANSLALDQIRIGGQITLISPKVCKFKVPDFAKKVDAFKKELEDGSVLSDLRKFNNLTSTKNDGEPTYDVINPFDASSSIAGYVNMQYIRQTKKFIMNAGLTADLWGIITGNAKFGFYSEPGKWNLNLGTYDSPSYLKFMDFVKCRSYFEMGHLARNFYPPLNAQAAKEFGYSGDDYSSSKEDLKGGKGFAFAIDMHAGLNIEPLKVAYLDLYMYGGTDLMVSERPYQYKSKCRNWRASGDVYGSFGVKLGAMIDIGIVQKKIKIFHGSAFLGLRGELPSPVYGEGLVKFNASFGEGWFEIDKSYRASFGENAKDCESVYDLKNMYDENE